MFNLTLNFLNFIGVGFNSTNQISFMKLLFCQLLIFILISSSEIHFEIIQKTLEFIDFQNNSKQRDVEVWKNFHTFHGNNSEILVGETKNGEGFLSIHYKNENWDQLASTLNPKAKIIKGVKVHTEIFELMNSFNWKEIKQKLKDFKQLYITGHSIGGSIAVLSSVLKLQKFNFKCITYASPLVIDQMFQIQFKNISQHFYSFYTNKDIIPGTLTGDLVLKLHKNTKIEVNEIAGQIMQKSNPFLQLTTNQQNYEELLKNVVTQFKQKMTDLTISYEPFGYVYLIERKKTTIFYQDYSKFKFHIAPPSYLTVDSIFQKEYLTFHSFQTYSKRILKMKNTFLKKDHLKTKILIKSNVLVIGGAGYIGSHTILKMKKKFKIFVLDDLSTGKSESIDNIQGVTFIKKSFHDLKFLSDIVKNSKIEIILVTVKSILIS
jgi:hypothetical protein